MKKNKCNVVMLPESGKELVTKCNCNLENGNTHAYHCGLVLQTNKLYLNGFFVNLYITSNEEIKEGDWFLWYSQMNEEFSVHKYHSDAGYGIKTYTHFNEKDGSRLLVNYSGVCGKIIATTDPELHKDGVAKIGLPFIEEYITEYNKGNVIKEVNVEIGGHYKLPITRADGTIIIHKVQEVFTKEDMMKAFYLGRRKILDFDTWFEQNY